MAHPTSIDGPWDLPGGVLLIFGMVEPMEEAGFAVGLTGSVLARGRSENDLDIIIYPLQSTAETNFDKAREVLKARGWSVHVDKEQVKRKWRNKGFTDEKEVEVWKVQDRRVDVFFLR